MTERRMDITEQLHLVDEGRVGPFPRAETVRAAIKEIERLREALQEFGDHRYECETNHDKACTCGYATALDHREEEPSQ